MVLSSFVIIPCIIIVKAVAEELSNKGGIFRERMNLNRSYLLELDTQCLLQNFYLEAGIIMPELQVVSDPEHANLHWGWEAPTCQLRGHFLGHWMSAAARLIASEHDVVLQQKLDFIVSELPVEAKLLCHTESAGEFPIYSAL